jgi:predicted AAA+ superfamily ATPase
MAFVAGPRQVGKTTLVKSLLQGTQGYFNWDIETHRKRILRHPEEFWIDRAARAHGKARIALDEIHKYPRWKRFLKGLFDAERDRLEILVSGSGRLDVYQQGGDSLVGRYNLHRLHPFTVGELLANGNQTVLSPGELLSSLETPEAKPGAEEALERIETLTGFPEPLFASSEAKLKRWRRSRRQLVLREDLRDLTRIRELGLVDQLVSILPDRVGSPLSINALREDLQVAFDTVQGWLKTLERLYFIFELRPYSARITRALRREGKFYLFDATEIEEPGARFENVVALHLMKLVDAWNDLGHGDFALHYVRDKEKREVDFLISNRRKPYLLIESKLSEAQLSPSLSHFAEHLAPTRAIQVVRRGATRTVRGVGIIPADRFLALI